MAMNMMQRSGPGGGGMPPSPLSMVLQGFQPSMSPAKPAGPTGIVGQPTSPSGSTLQSFNPPPSTAATRPSAGSPPGPAGSEYPYGVPDPIEGGAGYMGINPLGASNQMLGDTSVFSKILAKSEPAFEQRAKDYVSQGMADAGFMGARYGSFGAREAGRQGERAALESQAMFQPLLMQNLGLNLQNRNSSFQNLFQTAMAEQNRQDMFSKMAYEDYMRRVYGYLPFMQPQGQQPTLSEQPTPSAMDPYMMYLLSQMYQQ